MKPELKLGRPVIAWDALGGVWLKGTYIQFFGLYHKVLCDCDSIVHNFSKVKPDLTAEPMNGDEVDSYDDQSNIDRWIKETIYIGQKPDGNHMVLSKRGAIYICSKVRFPQPSKQERVKQILDRYHYPITDFVVDKIDKIYTEE